MDLVGFKEDMETDLLNLANCHSGNLFEMCMSCMGKSEFQASSNEYKGLLKVCVLYKNLNY